MRTNRLVWFVGGASKGCGAGKVDQIVQKSVYSATLIGGKSRRNIFHVNHAENGIVLQENLAINPQQWA